MPAMYKVPNVEGALAVWRRSPLRPLIEKAIYHDDVH